MLVDKMTDIIKGRRSKLANSTSKSRLVRNGSRITALTQSRVGNDSGLESSAHPTIQTNSVYPSGHDSLPRIQSLAETSTFKE